MRENRWEVGGPEDVMDYAPLPRYTPRTPSPPALTRAVQGRRVFKEVKRGHMGESRSSMTGALNRRGNLDPATYRGKTLGEHRGKVAACQSRREASEETSSADTLASDVSLQTDNAFPLFKPRGGLVNACRRPQVTVVNACRRPQMTVAIGKRHCGTGHRPAGWH